jgi:hypothetical protein
VTAWENRNSSRAGPWAAVGLRVPLSHPAATRFERQQLEEIRRIGFTYNKNQGF